MMKGYYVIASLIGLGHQDYKLVCVVATAHSVPMKTYHTHVYNVWAVELVLRSWYFMGKALAPSALVY